MKRVDAQDREHIKELSKTLTQHHIAERTGFKQCSISNALHDRHNKGMAKKWTLEHALEWRHLMRQRDGNNKPIWNTSKIAKKYGTSHNVIMRKLEEYGV